MFRPGILMRNESVDVPSAYIVASQQLGVQDGEGNADAESPESFVRILSSRVESRRKYVLIVAILDIVVGLGQLIYHINRAIYFFDYPAYHLGKYEHLSWASYVMWTLTFLVSTMQISMGICLVTASHSKSSLDLSRGRIRKCSLWILTSQLLLAVLVIKIIIFTASSQLEFDLGVFYVLLEDSSSVWFVLIFYSLHIVFRGFAIYLVKKYIQYLE